MAAPIILILTSILLAIVLQTFVQQSFTFSSIQLLLIVAPFAYWVLGNWIEKKNKKPVIQELWIFPIKSCGGTRVQSAKLDWLGFVNDRRFMVVKPDGKFVTQRQFPKMRLIVPVLAEPLNPASNITLTAPDMPALVVSSVPSPSAPILSVEVWNSIVEAVDVGDEAAKWLTNFIGTPVRLVHTQPKGSHSRPMNPKYAVKAFDVELKGNTTDNIQVPFTDAYPLHLITTESVDHLNTQVPSDTVISLLNFRANLVVSGAKKPYDEDFWLQFALTRPLTTPNTEQPGQGNLTFSVVKPCDRCTVPTVQASGTYHPKFEPRKTLLKYRKSGEEVYFGQNVIQEQLSGIVREGDVVTVLKRAEKPSPDIPHNF